MSPLKKHVTHVAESQSIVWLVRRCRCWAHPDHDSQDGFRAGCRKVCRQQQSFSGLQSLRWLFSMKVCYSWVQTIFLISILLILVVFNSKTLVTTSPNKQHYRLGLCYVFNLQYRPISTYYTQKLVYKIRTNCPKSLSTSSRTLQTNTQQETVTYCFSFHLTTQSICITYLRKRLHSQSHLAFTNGSSIYWPIKLLTRFF